MNRIFAVGLAVGLLVTTPNANATVVGSPKRLGQSYSSGILAPGPITPTPISGRQVCRTIQTVVGITGLWQAIGNKVSIWITIPVYGTSVICTYIYY